MENKNSKLIFLGTGTSVGVPVIGIDHPVCFSNDEKDKRLRSSVMIIHKGLNILIDCGPDFRQQILRAKITKIDALFLTHEHNDHVLGLDDLRPLIFISKKSFPIFGLERTLNEIKTRFAYAFATENKYPGAPSFDLNYIKPNDFFIFKDLKVEVLEVIHGKLPIIGYKIDDLVYITDANFIDEKIIETIKKCKILVINALNNQDKHHSHFVLSDSLEIIKKVNPEYAFLTHISHTMGFHDEVQKILPENVFLAYDKLEVDF